ncbi:exodeoxyribonuclease V subunit gamma [Variovorax sp.]|uniref:exodeoxyribonuclease V subunit gamma n=1 Tax=Variovorax sp. TaxID=1871043 RepID=UPI002D363446|nr:exodeoxyribonuclease V subunit gamma [Variovorax sp.]HYP85548.1 exodeoxyribonuclease V subunit gamma [Variovorax sp.]
MEAASVHASPSHDQSLAPGFMVVHGNHPEALRDLLLAWLGRHPLGPLEDEWVLVQSNGVAQWLRLSLARTAREGGAGIAAAMRTELPAAFIWRAYRAVLGESAVPAASPFDKSLLAWRLMRLLPALLHEPAFAPLARFLAGDEDLRKRYQLAERLADLFDQYQVYRADWLADWAAGRDRIATSRHGEQPVPDELRWQPRLWRALQEDVGAAAAEGGRAAVHRRFLAAAQAARGQARPAGLPRRLVVFGISSLPQQALEVLAALAQWVQVLMCVHNPCEHDWSDIVADKDLLRAEHRRQRPRPVRATGAAQPGDAQAALHLNAQPLLAAWGKQGRDFIRLLDHHDELASYAQRFADIGQRVDHFEANAGDTLLRQLQDDIRDLRPLDETRGRWPAVDAAAEHSLRFHVTHGPQREVEVLHDELLAAFAHDPGLQPRDVIVMVPDIAAYAPHVQAVFGLPAPGDPRRIPFSIADQGLRHHDPLLGALERLLSLPQSRIAVSDVLDWLEVPSLRERFGIDESQLPLLHRWVRAANVRWGLHAPQRQALELPLAGDVNSWDFGLKRMLLGYAAGDGPAWCGIEPLDEIGGLESALLGPLVRLVETLERHWRLLGTAATPVQWGERLRVLLADFFDADAEEADGLTLRRLEQGLLDWEDACAAADFTEALPLSVVREHWLAQVDAPALSQPFLAGGVTFATLLPMRAIPFRVVALLGMNDGDYPRSRPGADFDLMAQDFRPGDRSRREDDRYLFLEALLSARERLHLSWVGRSIHDPSERAPSVLVAQLRDHIAAGWRLRRDEALAQEDAGRRLLAALTREHRLQPFDNAYFDTAGRAAGLFSYAREWRLGRPHAPVDAPVDVPVDAPAGEAVPELPPSASEAGPLTLKRLGDFMRNPVREFFRQRLGVYFESDETLEEDEEPFRLDALVNWKLQDELIAAQRGAIEEGVPADGLAEVRAAALARMARRGDLPQGEFGVLEQEALARPMDEMFERYASALQDWPVPLPHEALELPSPWPADPSARLADWLDHLRANHRGDHCRLLLLSSGLIKDKTYRLDKIAPQWVTHLAAHCAGVPLTTHLISKAGVVTLPQLPAGQAQAAWQALVEAWRQGMRRPLPLALQCGREWLARGGQGGSPEAAWEGARKAYEGDAFSGGTPERDQSQELARAYPDFQALWAAGEFAHWCEQLLAPLWRALHPQEGDA